MLMMITVQQYMTTQEQTVHSDIEPESESAYDTNDNDKISVN